MAQKVVPTFPFFMRACTRPLYEGFSGLKTKGPRETERVISAKRWGNVVWHCAAVRSRRECTCFAPFGFAEGGGSLAT